MGRGDAMLTPTNSFLFFGDSYVCDNFGENRSRNATVRVPTDGCYQWGEGENLWTLCIPRSMRGAVGLWSRSFLGRWGVCWLIGEFFDLQGGPAKVRPTYITT